MNTKRNNITIIFLTVIMVFGLSIVLTVGVSAVNEPTFRNEITRLQNQFSKGKYWNGNSNEKNSDSTTTKACTCHWGSSEEQNPCKENGSSVGCTCNYYSITINGIEKGAIQCMGFAYKLGGEIFGSSANWTEVSLDELRPGDIIRGSEHTIFVTEVIEVSDNYNDTIVKFADCNWGARCIIRWDIETTIRTIESDVGYSYEVLRASNNNIGKEIHITTATELAAIGGEQSEGKHYVLDNDINLTSAWTPIDDFRGTLDGNGYSINNLYMSGYINYAGLFGIINSSNRQITIKNLGINIGENGVSTYYTAGGLIGECRGMITIENCYVNGGILSLSTSISGGLIGHINSNGIVVIKNCYATGEVYAYSPSFSRSIAGGLVGFCNGTLTVENCYTENKVTSYSGAGAYYDSFSGGVIGRINGSGTVEIKNCYTIGNISASVIGDSIPNSGGLVGACEGTGTLTIESCYTIGDSSSFSNSSIFSSNAGGLIGRCISTTTIKNCYTRGNISASNSPNTGTSGGLIGLCDGVNDTNIINSYTTGNVSGSSNAGGLFGICIGTKIVTIENCYRLSTQLLIGKKVDQSGISITQEQMKNQLSFVNWDFINVWDISPYINDGYPHLRYNYYFSLPSDTVKFNGHRYKLYDIGISWEEAKVYCEKLGGHLVTITSQEENDFLFNYITSLNYKNAYFGAFKENNIWNWVTGEDWIYTNWGVGEPNNSLGRETYGMFYKDQPNGKWNDGGPITQSASSRNSPFICEWDNVAQDGASITGKVSSYNAKNDITITLWKNGNKTKYSTVIEGQTTSESKRYEQTYTLKNIPDGIYDIVITKTCHLTYTIKNVIVNGSDIDISKYTIVLVVGDVEDVGEVNLFSVSKVYNSQWFNKIEWNANGYNPKYDIDGDGTITIMDIKIIYASENFNKVFTNCVVEFSKILEKIS